jgi:hypothetical protein
VTGHGPTLAGQAGLLSGFSKIDFNLKLDLDQPEGMDQPERLPLAQGPGPRSGRRSDCQWLGPGHSDDVSTSKLRVEASRRLRKIHYTKDSDTENDLGNI